MFRRGIRAAIYVALFVPSVACAADRSNIAVLDLKANNSSQSDAAAISGFVRTAVVRADLWNVVDKGNMDRILAEQAFQQTGCTSQECAVKLGKLLNVQKMIVGDYTVLENTRFINA